MTKKLLYPIVAAIMLLMLLNVDLYAAESDASYNVVLQKEDTPGSGQEPDIDDKGRRMPARPLRCTISQISGITIVGCTDEIIDYEIWDADGNGCMFSGTDQSAFVDEIFSLHGVFLIRLYSDAHTYRGYISIL